MTVVCPHGHESDISDYCAICGAPIDTGADAGVAPPPGGADAASPDAASPDTASPDTPDDPAVVRCPNCGSPSGSAAVCGECGFRLEAPDSLALWEEQVWEIVVRPDREYYELMEPEGMEFPETTHSRRVLLVGDDVRIGRRSASRGITPEVDLSGSVEDTGVSHRHAVLMRQPDGSWALVDLGSTNGTFLNQDPEPIEPNEPVPLAHGDRVHLGAWTTLTIERLEDGATLPFEVENHASKDTRAVARNRRLDVEISLLGPLQLVVAGEPVVIGAAKARGVLALLALRIGSSVSATDLEWALWGDDEPRTAGKAVQGYVSTLRRVLPAGAIETTPQGYRLLGPKDRVDIFRFERRATRGRELLASGHPGSGVAEITRALDLWRGDPIAELAAGPIGTTEVPALFERRARAEEDRFDGRLQLGDHQGAVADLGAAVEAEPLRERRWSQLMLALYRCGRQVDALRAYQRLRTLLGEEHGVEPSTEIVALERSIVLDKPELRWAPPGAAALSQPG